MKSSRYSAQFSARLAAIALAALFSIPGHPQEDAARNFPNRPIRLLVGLGPGGGNDIVARFLAARMADGLGQPVVVENKPGAQGIIAAEFVAKSAPDGYTLLMGPSGPMTVNPAIYTKLPYSPLRDFVPITMVGTFPLVLVANPTLPVRSVKELVDYAKANPNQIYYASASAAFQLAAELFNQKTGTRFVHVPYKSSAEIHQAVATAQVTISIDALPPLTGPMKNGTARGLAVLTAARHPKWPDLPSIAEAGVRDLEVTIFYGLFAPARTPMPVVRKVQEEVARVIRMPDIRERLSNMGVDPSGNTSEEFGRIVEADIAKWTAVAKAANIKAD